MRLIEFLTSNIILFENRIEFLKKNFEQKLKDKFDNDTSIPSNLKNEDPLKYILSLDPSNQKKYSQCYISKIKQNLKICIN